MRVLVKLLLAGGLAMSVLGRAAAPIEGTFIQLQSWMRDLTADQWKAELRSMKRVGIQTVILQWLRYDDARFFPVHVEGTDPVKVILEESERLGMKVFLGLWFHSDWWKRWHDARYLEDLARWNVEFARTIWERYRGHGALAGWYLPFEMADTDFDEQEIVRLRKFLRQLSDGCHRLGRKNLPVAKSVFFTRKLPVEAIEKIYGKLLAGAGIDILIVQDGVGAQGWQASVRELAVPYLRAFRRVGEKVKARTWLALEVFSTEKDARGMDARRVPAELSQLTEQIEVEVPLFEKTVMFDFFHYMSPHRGEDRRLLYEGYLREYGPGDDD